MIFDATSKSWPKAQCVGEHGQSHEHITYWLVVSIPLKNISQLGLLWLIIPNIWKNKLFQTINQDHFFGGGQFENNSLLTKPDQAPTS